MPEFIVGPTTEELANVYWAKVIAYSAGGAWSRDRGKSIPIYSYTSMLAKEYHFIDGKGNVQVKKKPFSLHIDGNVVVEYSQDEHEPFSESGGSGGSISGTSYDYSATNIVQSRFGIGAGTSLLRGAPEPARKNITFQNVGVVPIWIGRGIPGGSGVIALDGSSGVDAVLASGATPNDGTGGIVSWDNYIGAIYGRPVADAAGAALLMSVTSY